MVSAVGIAMNLEADSTQINAAGNCATIAVGESVFLGAQTYTSTATSLTVTDLSTLHIVGEPVDSCNVTGTRKYSALIETGSLGLGIPGGSGATLKWGGSTSGVVTMQVAAAAGTYTLTWPVNDGDASQFLQTNGSGVLVWAGGGGLCALVCDTTPQVGGSAGLDLQTQLLVGNGGTTGIAISSVGEVNMVSQPAFLAHNSAQNANVTGNGCSFITVEFDTEIYDQNADFNNTCDIFTAPVTGRYLLETAVRIAGFTTAASEAILRIVTSNNTYNFFHVIDCTVAELALRGSVIADMDAADTATITIRINGECTDVVDIQGSGRDTHFSGMLLA